MIRRQQTRSIPFGDGSSLRRQRRINKVESSSSSSSCGGWRCLLLLLVIGVAASQFQPSTGWCIHSSSSQHTRSPPTQEWYTRNSHLLIKTTTVCGGFCLRTHSQSRRPFLFPGPRTTPLKEKATDDAVPGDSASLRRQSTSSRYDLGLGKNQPMKETEEDKNNGESGNAPRRAVETETTPVSLVDVQNWMVPEAVIKPASSSSSTSVIGAKMVYKVNSASKATILHGSNTERGKPAATTEWRPLQQQRPVTTRRMIAYVV